MISISKLRAMMKAIPRFAGSYAKLLFITVASAGSMIVPVNAATFHGLGMLPGGDTSFVIALSGDGKVAVGNATVPVGPWSERHSFRWTEESGLQSLGYVGRGFQLSDEAFGVSADGSLIIGMLDTAHAYVWSQSAGFQSLPNLGNQTQTSTWAYGISSDGGIIVGSRTDVLPSYSIFWTNADGPIPLFDAQQWSTAIAVSDDGLIVTGSIFLEQQYTYRRTAVSGVQVLMNRGGVFQGSSPQGMSRDGSVIVGVAYSDNGNHREMYRWTTEDGLVGLGVASGDIDSEAFGVSNDGDTVVGGAGPQIQNYPFDTTNALIWRPEWGLRHLQDVLTNVYHLDLTGWHLTSARAVSTDGTVIVGNGFNPSGQIEAWIATIDPAASPVMRNFSIQRLGNKCVLTWPTNAVGLVLEQSTDGTLRNWKRVSKKPAVAGKNFVITNSMSTANSYFRLHAEKVHPTKPIDQWAILRSWFGSLWPRFWAVPLVKQHFVGSAGK